MEINRQDRIGLQLKARQLISNAGSNQILLWQMQIVLLYLKVTASDLVSKYPDDSMFKTIEAPKKEYCGVSISSIRRRKRILRLKQIE